MERMFTLKPEELTPQLIDHIFENLNLEKLDDWNQKFVESARQWWKRKKKLSDKQKKRLGELWEAQISE